MTWLLTRLIRLYQITISPLLGPSCRYHPSCSSYAMTSLQKHGALRGSWLAVRRLGRCHPFTDGGVDLVPEPEDYRWWGRCPGHDPDTPASPRHRHTTQHNDAAAAEGA